MTLAEDRLSDRLLEEESVQDLTAGRLLEDVVRGRAAIGLTDRRLLCLSKTGEFVDVRYDYVCSIRSRRRTKVRFRDRNGNGRTLHVVGGLFALGAVVVGVFVATSIGALQTVVTAVLAAVTATLALVVDRLRKRPDVERTRDSVFLGGTVVALSVCFGVGLVSSSVFAPLFVVLVFGGAALGEYALRHREDLNRIGLERHHEMVCTVRTVDGETVHVAVDATSDFDRELATRVHRTDPAPVDVPAVRA